jgi:hypothetical protein
MDVNLTISLLILSAFILLGISQYEHLTNEVSYVKSDIDNNEYLVRNRDDKQQAADLLAKVRLKLEKIISSMKQKYPNDKSVLIECLKNLMLIIYLNQVKSSQYTSYSVNKGEKIVFLYSTKR